MNIFIRMILALLIMSASASIFAADVVIYVTRHGKTMFNTVDRVQGWSDTPLTEAGVKVAQQLGRGLRPVDFLAVWSSDSGRARQTAAEIVAQWTIPVPLLEDENLREVNFGLYEGDLNETMLTDAAHQIGLSSRTALIEAFTAGHLNTEEILAAISRAEASGTAVLKGIKSTGQVENFQQVATRMTQSVTRIARQAQQQGGGNVLVVTHGQAISVLLQSLGYPLHLLPGNAGVTRLRYTENGRFIVESVNDMSYVQQGAS